MTPENKAMVEEWAESGWYPAIKQCADNLVEICPQIEFLQIKAKFGSLRFYYQFPDVERRDRHEAQVDEAITYATGWVDGYESRRQEVADLKDRLERLQRALEETVRDRDLILEARGRGEIDRFEAGRQAGQEQVLREIEAEDPRDNPLDW